MNKGFKIFFMIIFVAICMFPLCFMPFFKNDASLEKRELSPLPSFFIEKRLNIQFSTQFESWLNDRIPLRANILSAANAIKGETLETPTSNVIIGKEGWLYYNYESKDFMDTNAMSKDQLKAFGVTLSLIEENINSRGGKFTFVPMPNKSSVYGEYMPYYYTKSEENNLTRVMKSLSDYGVNYVDMKKLMVDNKSELLYHVRDSHWNYKGAFIGYKGIMESLGKDYKKYEGATATEKKDWRGDLDKLIYPAGGTMDDQYYYDMTFAPFRFTLPRGVADAKSQLENFMSDKEEGDDNFKTQSNTIKDGSELFMARDSFGRALLPYMIDNYEKTTFKRTDCPDITSIADGSDMVYEIAERNLAKVIAKAPFMFAPERDASVVSGKTDKGNVEANASSEGYGIKLGGYFPEGTEVGDNRVYVSLSGSDKDYTFEVFPINEDSETAEKKISGFSGYISKDSVPSGDYRIKIVVGDNVFDGGKVSVK